MHDATTSQSVGTPSDDGSKGQDDSLVGCEELRDARSMGAIGDAAATDAAHERLKELIRQYGAKCRIDGAGDGVKAAYAAVMDELQKQCGSK